MALLRRLLLALLVCLAAAPGARAATDYTTSPELREEAIAALLARVGATRPLVRLSIGPEEIAAVAESEAGDGYAEWIVRRLNLMVFNVRWVNGPRPAAVTMLADDPASLLFGHDEVDATRFDAVVGNAITYARMRTLPRVEAVEVSRALTLLPKAAYGEVQWVVRLRTDGESAVVYTNAAGQVTGGDLSDTLRGRELDLIARDDWPMAEAQALLRRAIGTAGVHELSIGKDAIIVTADHPTDAGLQRDYVWSLEGVRQGLVDTPNLLTLGLGGAAAFDLGEVDLTALPKIKGAALAAFEAPDAAIVEMAARKPTDTPAAVLRVLWEVALRQRDGATGKVWLTADGVVTDVQLPEGRRPVLGPWLAPETLVDTLARIGEAFGSEARLYSLLIDDSHAVIEIEDPLRPGELAQFIADDTRIERFGTASFFADLAPEHVFTMGDLAPLTAGRLGEMAAHTLATLGRDDLDIYRYTISRQALILYPEDTRLMVEIRAGKDRGNVGGWVTFLLDGSVTDTLLP